MRNALALVAILLGAACGSTPRPTPAVVTPAPAPVATVEPGAPPAAVVEPPPLRPTCTEAIFEAKDLAAVREVVANEGCNGNAYDHYYARTALMVAAQNGQAD